MSEQKFNRAIKYRAYPTEAQIKLLKKTFGACRFYYNKALDDAVEFRLATDIPFVPTPARYKARFPFLKEVDSLALCNEQFNLQRALKADYIPKHKSKKSDKASYTTANNITSTGGKKYNSVYLGKDFVHLPKIGDVKIKKHRSPQNGWKLKAATVERNKLDEYYISLLYEFTEDIQEHPVDPEKVLALNYSVGDFYVDQNGNSGDYPQYYRQMRKKLDKQQRKLSKMEEGSANYLEQKQKINRMHQKIANARKDFCHNKSARLADEFDAVCLKDLDLQKLVSKEKKTVFGRYSMDNGFGMFRTFLEYKLKEQGKTLIKTDRYFPYNKVCSQCGYLNADLAAGAKEWTCPGCGAIHNTKENAAMNILALGMDKLNK